MNIKRQVIRSILANAYKSPGFGYGGYGGGKRYRPKRVPNLRSGKPLVIPFRRQRLERKRPEDPFGTYVVWVKPEEAEGTVKLKRPLIVPWSRRGGWVDTLNETVGASNGRELSRNLTLKRYDGIITVLDQKSTEGQLDLFYDYMGGKPAKGLVYQIVILDDRGVEYIEEVPTSEEIFDRYFAYGPDLDVRGGGEVYSYTVSQFMTDISDFDYYIENFEQDMSEREDERSNLEDSEEEAREALESFNEFKESVEDFIDNAKLMQEAIDRAKENAGVEDSPTISDLRKVRDVDLNQIVESVDTDDYFDFSFDDFIKVLRDPETGVYSDMAAQAISDVIEARASTLEEAFEEVQRDLEYVETRIEELQTKLDGLNDERNEYMESEVDDDLSESLTKLAGVYGLPSSENYDVEIKKEGDDEYTIMVSGPYIRNFERTVNTYYRTIANDHLKLDPDAPSGLGTRILYSQALAAKSEGYMAIKCYAAKGYGYQGYYVWPRLGYNGGTSIDGDFIVSRYGATSMGSIGLSNYEILSEMIREKILPEYVTPDTPLEEINLSDLMMTKKGRDWWKQNGKEFYAYFDLEDQSDGSPSRSMQILSSYVRLKEEARGETMDRWAYDEMDPKGPPELELTPQDEEILDVVWDMVREREVEKRLFGL